MKANGKRMAAPVLAGALLALLTACGAGGDDSSGESGLADAPADGRLAPAFDDAGAKAEGAADRDSAGGNVLTASITATVRSVIRTVDLVVWTQDVADAAAEAQQKVAAAGGFVAQESTTVDPDDSANTTARLVLRVPVDSLTRVVGQLEALGTVVERTQSAQDVTEQIVDVDSRVESQRRSIERVRALLTQAKTLQDVLALESDLAGREAELDSLLSRQQELTSLTELATVSVTLSSADAGRPDEDDDTGFLAGLRNGWDAFATTANALLTATGALLPFVVALAILAVPAWLVIRKRRDAALPASPAPTETPAATS